LGATTSDFSCWLVYLQFVWEVPLPHCPELPALFAMCLFFSAACLLFNLVFSLFFPWVGVSLSRGLC
jgi:hypothetical protein